MIKKQARESMTYFEQMHHDNQHRLPMWTVYESPSDYPGQYVARMFLVKPQVEATSLHIVADTLPEVYAQLPRGLYWMDRKPGDDPTIVGVWL